MTNKWLDRFTYAGSIIIFSVIVFFLNEIYSTITLNLDNEMDCTLRCTYDATFDRGKNFDKCYCKLKLVKIYK